MRDETRSKAGVFRSVLTGILVSLTLLLYREAADCQANMPKGHWRFTNLESVEISALTKEFLGDAVVPSESPAPSNSSDKNRIWTGVKSELATQLSDLILRYSAYKGDKGRSFFIFLTIGESGISLRASRTGLESPNAGLQLRWGERRIVPLTASGDENARMIVASLPAEEGDSRSIVLCPRILSGNQDESSSGAEVTNDQKRQLIESDFRIGALRTKVTGNVFGKCDTGFKPGAAQAKVLVSEDLPRSAEYQDRLFAVDPSVELEYKPIGGNIEETHEIAAAPEPIDSWISGIRIELETRKPAGYFRRATREHTVEIGRLAFDEAGLKFSNFYAPLNGACDLIHFKSKDSEEYGKGEEPTPFAADAD